jgi:hypothetical protein
VNESTVNLKLISRYQQLPGKCSKPTTLSSTFHCNLKKRNCNSDKNTSIKSQHQASYLNMIQKQSPQTTNKTKHKHHQGTSVAITSLALIHKHHQTRPTAKRETRRARSEEETSMFANTYCWSSNHTCKTTLDTTRSGGGFEFSRFKSTTTNTTKKLVGDLEGQWYRGLTPLVAPPPLKLHPGKWLLDRVATVEQDQGDLVAS